MARWDRISDPERALLAYASVLEDVIEDLCGEGREIVPQFAGAGNRRWVLVAYGENLFAGWEFFGACDFYAEGERKELLAWQDIDQDWHALQAVAREFVARMRGVPASRVVSDELGTVEGRALFRNVERSACVEEAKMGMEDFVADIEPRVYAWFGKEDEYRALRARADGSRAVAQ